MPTQLGLNGTVVFREVIEWADVRKFYEPRVPTDSGQTILASNSTFLVSFEALWPFFVASFGRVCLVNE